jgi:hypothetical protein
MRTIAIFALLLSACADSDDDPDSTERLTIGTPEELQCGWWADERPEPRTPYEFPRAPARDCAVFLPAGELVVELDSAGVVQRSWCDLSGEWVECDGQSSILGTSLATP